MPIDLLRVQRYAQLVARESRGVPKSTLPLFEQRKAGWFSRPRLEDTSTPLDGWILLRYPEEGFAQCWKVPPYRNQRMDATESGRLLFLSTDGVLSLARYEHFQTINLSSTPNTDYGDRTTLNGKAPVKDSADLTLFDGLRDWAYRDITQRRNRHDDWIWQRELHRFWSRKTPPPGIKTTLALKALREKQEYIERMSMLL